MNYLNLAFNNNAYKLNERTQVMFCFTVSGREYALFLINQLKNARFESYCNFRIYCEDMESENVLKAYGIPYINATDDCIDIYNAKVINAMKLSIDFPNTLIIAIDSMIGFDFHDTRGTFGRLKGLKNNTIYYKDYYDTYGNTIGYFNRPRRDVHGQVLFYYNIKNYKLVQYVECIKKCDKNIKYDSSRYFNKARVTEESVLTMFKHKLKLKHMNNDMLNRLHHCFVDFGGGNTIKYMIENRLQYYRYLYINDDIFKDLIG